MNIALFLQSFLIQLYALKRARALLGVRLRPVIRCSSIYVTKRRDFRFPIMRQLFAELVDDPDRIIWLDGDGVQCPEAVTTSPLLRTDLSSISLTSVQYARQEMLALIERRSKGRRFAPPRIWISRKEDGNNEYGLDHIDAAEALAVDHGFAPVVVSRLYIDEMFEVFANARTFAGLHGAGLVNFMFSKSFERLIECKYAYWTYESLASLASAWGGEVDRIPVVPQPNGKLGISLDELTRSLKSLSAT